MLFTLPQSQISGSDSIDDSSNRSEPSERLKIHPRGAPGREAVEQYIQAGFRRTHRAEIQSFMPVLLSLDNEQGQLNATLGYRPAEEGPFFLERYLNEPVHMAIGKHHGLSVPRATIVEIGNLSCANPAAAARLMWAVARYLIHKRYRWVVFTGTRAVREIMRIFPAQLTELGEAREACAGATGDHWGRYYRSDPRIVAGYLPDAFPNQDEGALK